MIRQFQSRDAACCSTIIQACLEGDPSYSLPLLEKIRSTETAQAMIERARLFYVVVCQLKNEIVGVAGLDLNEIRLLYVSPKHRKRGIGSDLLVHMKSMVPGFLFSDIFVYSSLQAVGFYAACGFIEKGPYIYDLAGEPLKTVFMTSAIDA
jgi:GNAT superfamily N-acetyltransferase